ncbi:hypothetical protein JAAARDRAFT_487028 [Jaapia argillacea MUCL 33604]|uniref:Uncharacterized protein n=1 Tax=Jaapia argillacea MUCL 33604 TaxID=933084 RepID=A0A067PBG6_9AGAM|nr:hypothetical protein JAAARDRAFT_487028 [Jaapia argillacea MUCL 33604]
MTPTIPELFLPSHGGGPHHNPTATTFRNVVGLIPVQMVSSTKKERGPVLTLLGCVDQICRAMAAPSYLVPLPVGEN